jgi:tRNA nucleotidyltransferase (CCA-adding enzyme)
LFLAGGVVRDLLLGRPIRDVDLVVEGDALAFARRLAARLGATPREHGRFTTATLELEEGGRLDVAATRRERYVRSGALPEVTPGVPIEEDLGRRDFSINALALELTKPPRLLDPFGGRGDLRSGLVRVLHPLSFVDDPTRILRSVRYAARLGFRLAPATRRLLLAAVAEGALERISADRLRREIRLILEEPTRERAIALMGRLGVAAAVHPVLSHPGAAAAVRCAGATADWVCYLRAWMGDASDLELDGVASKLGLSRAERRSLFTPPRGARETGAIRGADLVAAGVPAGPAIGRALAKTRQALEDGRIGRDDELAFALRIARAENT